jgi:hypothetical protein
MLQEKDAQLACSCRRTSLPTEGFQPAEVIEYAKQANVLMR